MAKSELEQIREKLGHITTKWQPKHWLDTGWPEVNAVLGHRDKGLLFGSITEISGQNSTAKTAMALLLTALAQKEKCGAVWINCEGGNFDVEWATQRGVDTEKGFTLIEPYVGTFGKDKEERLSTAEELCAEAEHVIGLNKKYGKWILVVDSVAAMETEYEGNQGLTGQNLRSHMSLPVFLSGLLRRWVGFAQARNVLVILLNQLRENPMAKFTDSWYTPGGNAIPFYAHTRVRMRRAKGGKMKQGNKQIGIQGVVKCIKNKSGGFEGAEIGFKMRFDGPMEFLSATDLKRDTGEEE